MAALERPTPDILARLADLHKQATVERSHHYTGACIRDAMAEITRLRAALTRLRDCDWVITPLDRMDAVRDIARAALDERDERPHG